MSKKIPLSVKILVFMPLTLLQTVISPEYKGIEVDTKNLKVTGTLHSHNDNNFLKSSFIRSDTWI
jgi:hypothetical protein